MIKLLLLILFVLLLGTVFKKYEQFYTPNLVIFLNKNFIPKKILKDYIKKFSKYEISFKTNNNLNKLDRNSILEFYLDNILYFSEQDRKNIQKYIKLINNKCKNYKYITDTKWTFIMLSNEVENAMPFTLGNIIFLPQYFVKKMKSDNNINICDTLIHEKIHIIQRYNQNIFNNFYLKQLNAIKLKNIKISNYWKSKNLKNPDGIDINWVYKYKDEHYLPILLFNNSKKEVNQKIVKLDSLNRTTKQAYDIYKFPPFKKYSRNISLYHPNEISAYIIPKILLKSQKFNNKLNNLFSKFINIDLKNIYIS